MKPITSRQQQTLDFIKKYIAENGYSPSMREIGDGIDSLSPSTIQAIIGKLEDKGFITRQNNVPRSIRVVGQRDPRDALIESQKEEIELLKQSKADVEHNRKLISEELELKKAITELSVKGLKEMVNVNSEFVSSLKLLSIAQSILSEIARLSNENNLP